MVIPILQDWLDKYGRHVTWTMAEQVRDTIFLDILLNNGHRTGVSEQMIMAEYNNRGTVEGKCRIKVKSPHLMIVYCIHVGCGGQQVGDGCKMDLCDQPRHECSRAWQHLFQGLLTWTFGWSGHSRKSMDLTRIVFEIRCLIKSLWVWKPGGGVVFGSKIKFMKWSLWI